MVTKKLTRKAKSINLVLDVMLKMGIFSAARRFNSSALTVLNYHRIDDVSRPGFDTFAPNVTATPTEFARHMDYLRAHFNVISCEDLAAWLRGECELPPHPALITFDDGYYDNYANAYPILKARKLPAVIFLTTGLIDQDKPVYWDYVSYCFHHTQRKSVLLPDLQLVSWANDGERRTVIRRWIESAKSLPNHEKQSVVDSLADALNVSVPEDAFSGLYLTWDQVREMSQNGIEMGSHTVEHPILTRISLSQAGAELVQSKARIEAELGKPVIAFAYPNGERTDFSPEVMNLVHHAGYQLAFTLVKEPPYYSLVRNNPLSIPRVCLTSSDVFSRFVAKITWGQYLPV
jgi:peptidoglycan/xylan/chitin deacetylase (PgdA/CDA1 family)